MTWVKYALLCIWLTAITGCDTPQSQDPLPEQPVLRVGGTLEGYPHYFVEGGQVKGFSVEVLQAIADKIHYKVQWLTSDWVGVLGSLETGKIDTVGNFADTPQRREKYHYSVPYHYSSAALAVSKNNNDIHGLDDLAGKTVAAQLGSNYARVLKEYDPGNKIRLVTFEGTDVVVNSVAQGKADAMVSGEVILSGQIKRNHLPLKMVGEPFGEQTVALPFRKDERGDTLRVKVNSAIEALRADGTLKRLSEKWFERDLSISAQAPQT